METSQADVKLDCKGLNCPMPIVKTKKALDAMQNGQALLVEVTDKGAKADIPALLSNTGDELLGVEENGNVIRFLIKKKR